MYYLRKEAHSLCFHMCVIGAFVGNNLTFLAPQTIAGSGCIWNIAFRVVLYATMANCSPRNCTEASKVYLYMRKWGWFTDFFFRLLYFLDECNQGHNRMISYIFTCTLTSIPSVNIVFSHITGAKTWTTEVFSVVNTGSNKFYLSTDEKQRFWDKLQSFTPVIPEQYPLQYHGAYPNPNPS